MAGARIAGEQRVSLASPVLKMRGQRETQLELLAGALADPSWVSELSERQWDQLLRVARSGRLLGTLAVRIRALNPAPELPELAERHLDAALIEARFRLKKLRFLLRSVAPLFSANSPACVLLKGAAYVMQGNAVAAGRLPADVDVMVPRDRLGQVEAALLSAGWEFEKTDPYDQRYYRDWSHELPPMKCAGQALELDVHHAILPPQGSLRPDTALLFRESVPIDGSPYRALCADDQLLHSAAHLFHDSDCSNRMRDLVDFDGLLRSALASEQDVERLATRLVERASVLDLLRPLSYAAAFARAWCGTPGSSELASAAEARSGGSRSRIFLSLVGNTLGPPPPDQVPSVGRRASTLLLEARAAWLRMPLNVLAIHVTSKAIRSFGSRQRSSDRDASTEASAPPV